MRSLKGKTLFITGPSRGIGKRVALRAARDGAHLCVLGWAEEFRGAGIAVNALWPRTLLDTAAMAMVGSIQPGHCRRPDIVADAAHAILTRPSCQCPGNFFIDEEVLREEGVTDFAPDAVDPKGKLMTDLFVTRYGEGE